MRFTDFTEIDWRSAELDRSKLQEQKQQLEASSDHLKQLETQLKGTQQEIAQAEHQGASTKRIKKLPNLTPEEQALYLVPKAGCTNCRGPILVELAFELGDA